MKGTLIISALLLALSGCASLPANAPPFTPAPAPERGKGLLYIYRVGAYPTLRTPDILVNGKLLFAPPEKGYTWLHVPLGANRITIDWAWDTGWPDLEFVISVTETEPVFIKLTGSLENLGMSWQMGTNAVGVPPRDRQTRIAGVLQIPGAEIPVLNHTAAPRLAVLPAR